MRRPLPTKSTVEHHTPTGRATIRVPVRRRLGIAELLAVRSFAVIAVRVPQVPGAPPLLAMSSAQFSRPGTALELWPGQRVELVGDVPLLGSEELFHGQLGWAVVGIMPALVPMEAFELGEITIGGHPLPKPAAG